MGTQAHTVGHFPHTTHVAASVGATSSRGKLSPIRTWTFWRGGFRGTGFSGGGFRGMGFSGGGFRGMGF
ncbi:hypothetical protein KQX54_000267 [Cotesia glomerata]|uniref:Uncharacterized protein n=1 Tax=Cotesia glomerata TaxID=32391 RepID=A0AAV7HGK0_COTGL|nr:hypothetical protein KQX54_000267 [Cotesia glomerata]